MSLKYRKLVVLCAWTEDQLDAFADRHTEIQRCPSLDGRFLRRGSNCLWRQFGPRLQPHLTPLFWHAHMENKHCHAGSSIPYIYGLLTSVTRLFLERQSPLASITTYMARIRMTSARKYKRRVVTPDNGHGVCCLTSTHSRWTCSDRYRLHL